MGVEFSSNTLINIFTGEVSDYSGEYSKESGKLTLGENSWIKYIKEYSPTENPLKTDTIQTLCDVSVNTTDLSSRYNCNIKVKIKIQYYASVINEDGSLTYTTGQCQTFCITPYYTNETDGRISTYPITLKEIPIKRLELYIINTTSSEIDIVKFGIYKSLNVTESIGGSLAIEITLRKFQFWRNGIKVMFSTGDLDLKALKNTETQKFAGYNINDKLAIQSEDIDAEL